MADFALLEASIDPRGAIRGGKRVEKSLRGMGTQADKTGRRISNSSRKSERAFKASAAGVGGTAQFLRRTFFGLGVAVAGAFAFNNIREFSDKMATVRGITGATGEAFEDLSNKAQELGERTRFTAGQAAEGMEYLSRAGFDTTEVLGTIGPALTLASAASLTLKDSADIATNVMRQFGKETSEATNVMDILAYTGARSNQTVLELSEALKFAGPVASGFGISLETTSAAMAVLADSGIKASLAGTGLRFGLIQLNKAAEEGHAVLTKYGISQADVDFRSRGLVPVLKTLREANVDVSDAIKLVGVRAGGAFATLIKGSGALEEFEENLRASQGFAERLATTMEDSLAGDTRGLTSAIQGLILYLAEMDGGLLRGIVGGMRDFVRAITGSLEATTPLQKVLQGIVDVFKAVGPLLLSIIAGFVAFKAALGFSALVSLLTGKVIALNAAILLNPFVAVAAGVIALIAALVLYRKEIASVFSLQSKVNEADGRSSRGARFGGGPQSGGDGGVGTAASKNVADSYRGVNTNIGGTSPAAADALAGVEALKQARIDAENVVKGVEVERLTAAEQQENLLHELRLLHLNDFGIAFGDTWRQMEEVSLGVMATLGLEVAKIFGPGGSLQSGIADAAADALVFGKDWKENLKQVGLSIAKDFIANIIKAGLARIATEIKVDAVQDALAQKRLLTTVGQAKVATAAWTPAAVASSTASFGGAAIAGLLAFLAFAAAAKASQGFAVGGAFGSGGVVRKPTFFNAGGGLGVAGESGPEAVLPLANVGGNLGVRTTGGATGSTVNEINITVNVEGGADEEENARLIADNIQQRIVEVLGRKVVSDSTSVSFAT